MPCKPGQHFFKRSRKEWDDYSDASEAEKDDLNTQYRKREQSDCHEENCNNDAVDHPGWSLFGWCTGHSPKDNNDD